MNKYKILLVCISFCLCSCTDVLDTKPVSSITDNSFWNSENDANGVLTGAYINLRGQAASNLFHLGEARSEVMTRARSTGPERYYNNTLNPDMPGPDWKGFYTIINACNLLLKYVPDVEISSEISKNNILAQAYTMRAYIYFIMAKTWGGVPLRTEPTEGYNAETVQKPKSTAEEVFKLIKDDLDKAISLYNDNTFFATRNRWSRPAANALKAEVYLWTAKRYNGGNSDLTIALEACKEVEKANVELLPDFADLFEYENKCNTEVIMAVAFDPYESENNYFDMNYSELERGSIDPISGEIIGVANNGIVWTITELVRNQFSADDSRRDPTFVEFPDYPGLALVRKGRGIMISGVRSFTSDIVLYRYADVLLMKAEAKNALGQDPSEEINLIRKRAYGEEYNNHIFVSGTKEQNDEAILKERLLELVMEGKRWWDLVRFGKAFDIVPSLFDKKGQDYMLFFPIPQSTLSLEPQVEQVPGW